MTKIIPYSYDEIKELLKQKAIENELITDAEYEGSNISQLINIVSYAVQSCNVMTTFGANEMLLTQSTEYNNILKLARQLGYIPKRRISYKYKLRMRPLEKGAYTIKKYSEFSAGDYNYYYMGDDIEKEYNYVLKALFNTTIPTILPGYTIETEDNKEASILSIYDDPDGHPNIKMIEMDFSGMITDIDINKLFTIKDANHNSLITGKIIGLDDGRDTEIEVVEGILHKYYSEETNEGEKELVMEIPSIDGKPQSYVDLNYFNIEDDGIELYVTYFDENNDLKVKEPWKKRNYFIVDKDIFGEKRTFLPMINIDTGVLRIYFKIAETGYVPPLYSKLYFNLLESHGEQGRATDSFKYNSNDASLWFDVEVINIVNIGRDIEDIEKVRENAPTFHNTGNRAITKDDYIAICKRENIIDQVQCWGGETNLPVKELGHVYLSFLPSYRPKEFLFDDTKTLFILDKDDSDKDFNLKENEIQNVNETGILDTLNRYKVITLSLYEYKNIFVDFELKIDIRKYYITNNVTSINEEIKDIVVDYFHNELEVYDLEFFESNIIRIIDTKLGSTTGLKLALKTTIPLYTEHLSNTPITSDAKKIDIWFKYPFDGVLDKYGFLDNNLIPRIDTENFLRDNSGNYLYIGRFQSNQNTMPDSSNIAIRDDEIIELDIFYGTHKDEIKDYENRGFRFDGTPETDAIIGRCYINNIDKTILIRLFVRGDNSPSYNLCQNDDELNGYIATPMRYTDLDLHDTSGHIREPLRITLNYPFNDINFHKNTIPRLTRIEFL